MVGRHGLAISGISNGRERHLILGLHDYACC